MNIKAAFGVVIDSIPVNNAANKVSTLVVVQFHASSCTDICVSNPLHCVNLCTKDLAKVNFVEGMSNVVLIYLPAYILSSYYLFYVLFKATEV